jgi:hypothetical protein
MKIDIGLRRHRLVKSELDVRSRTDERRKVDRYTWEYLDQDGDDYRKAFECRRGTKPVVPERGNHDYINGFRIQWCEAVPPELA